MPANHEWFSSINSAQWHWYFQNIIEDRNDDFEMNRNLVEYHAGFIEPEVVDKIQKKREQQERKKNDSDFEQTLGSMFGREVSFEKGASSSLDLNNLDSLRNVLDIADNITRANKTIESKTKHNFAEWLDFDLEQ